MLPHLSYGPFPRFPDVLAIERFFDLRREGGVDGGSSHFSEPEMKFLFDFVIDFYENILVKGVNSKELTHAGRDIHVKELWIGEELS